MGDSMKVQISTSNELKKPASEPLTSPPPAKKLVQGRLPFKTLDPKPQTAQSTTPCNNKKRKLSDGNVPCGKQPKTPKNDEKSPKPTNDCLNADNEVSSSSEAECVKVISVEKKSKTATLLERFVRTTQKEEVSTTKSDEVVDLTDETPEADTSTKSNETKADAEDEEALTKSSEASAADAKPSESSAVSQTEQATSLADSAEDKENKSSSSSDLLASPDSEGNKENVSHSDGIKDTSMASLTGEEDSLLEASMTETESETEQATEGQEPTGDGKPKSESKDKSKPKGSRTRNPAEKEKRRAEREKLKQEKLEKREAEKLERQRQKEEKEKQKKEEREKRERERQEQRLKKEKEKQEKLEEKEREKEEKMRLKEEEQKKKQEVIEAKNEEKRKKDEEKKKKEDEKRKIEEEELQKKQKVKNQFASFFKKSAKPAADSKEEENSGPFQIFELKEHMELAPSHRVERDQREKMQGNLDHYLLNQAQKPLYLDELKTRSVNLGEARRKVPLTDVMIVEDSDAPKPVGMRAKYLKFKENYRPPYYGTWRKKSQKLTPRNPFKMDEALFDYEVDSDDEWEEEEPGESLSNSEGEGEGDGEENADDDEDDEGFFVPHGYLSDDEGCVEEDEQEGNPEKMKAQQQWKARNFEAERNKKTEYLKPVCTGCHWWAPDLSGDPNYEMLKAYQVVLLTTNPYPITLTKPETNNSDNKKSSGKAESESRGKPIQAVPDEALPDLIRLVHGNVWSVQKVIKEFRAFWSLRCGDESESNSNTPTPQSTSPAVEAMDVDSDPKDTTVSGVDSQNSSPKNNDNLTGRKCLISKRQLDICIKSMATYEKRDLFKRRCWYVNDDVLKKHSLMDLPVPTQWQWITRSNEPMKMDENLAQTPKSGRDTPTSAATTPSHPSIKQFTVPQSQLASPSLIKPTPTKAEPASPAGISTLFSPVAKSSTPKNLSTTPKGSPVTRKDRTTPISLFCKKVQTTPDKPEADSTTSLNLSCKKLSTNADKNNSTLTKTSGPSESVGASLEKPAAGKCRSDVIVLDDEDDECMIVEESLPTKPPKGQPSMFSMLQKLQKK